MSSTSRFQVHTPFLAMKSTRLKKHYVTLSIGTVGEILDVSQPGFVNIRVSGETLYTFNETGIYRHIVVARNARSAWIRTLRLA